MKYLDKSDLIQIKEIIRDYSNIFQIRSSDSKAIKFMAMRTADLMSKIEKELENDTRGYNESFSTKMVQPIGKSQFFNIYFFLGWN